MDDFSFEDFNFGSGNEEYDFSGLSDIGLGTDVQELDLSSLFGGGGGQEIDFSGFDNLDLSSLLGSGTDSLNFDNFSLEEGQGTQEMSDLFDSFSLEEGQGTQEMSDLFDSFSLEGDQGFKFDDDTEPGSSGGTEGSYGTAGEGDLGSYTGSSYTGGGSRSIGGSGGEEEKLVFDDKEPGSSGGTEGSTGVAGSGDLGSYKGSTYDTSGGTKTTVDKKTNVVTLPDGTKVTPGGTVVPPGVTPKTTTPTKTDTTKPAGKDNNMLMMMLALMAMMNKGGGSSTGSSGTIPSLAANRSQLPYGAISGSQARPGAGGVNYFSPTSYTQKAAGGGMMYGGGGISDLGGYSDGGRLLRGPGDGVSDSIPATIGGKQPARLAEGEFVVPARIVSELGNGSTEAGAKKLYAMMDRVQKARRKTKNIAADTKAHKYLPS